MKTPLSTRLVNQDFTICIILGALNDILALKIGSIVQAIVISRIDYCMVLPLRTLASSNGCKTRQSDWCDHCQDMNTSHRHLYVFTGCRLSLESILKIDMLYFKCIHGPSIKKAWSPSRRLRHTTSARAPVSSWKTIHDDRKNGLAIEPFPMHPPRFGTVSRNH